MIRVHVVRDWFRPCESRETVELPWSEGMRLHHACPDGWIEDHSSGIVNGSPAPWDSPIPEGAEVHLVDVPEFAIGSLTAVQVFFAAAAGFTLLGVSNSVLGALGAERDAGDTGSSVFDFIGLRTDYTAQGKVYPVFYGEHANPGRVLTRYTEVVDGPEPISYLYVLILLSAGPIESIGQYTTDQDGLTGDDMPEGMEIEGNAARNFSDVSVSLRMGSLDQDAIPGFNRLASQHSIGLPIENVTAASGLPAVTDWSDAAVYDMEAGTTADAAKLTLVFPAGLFRTSGGALAQDTVELQARYIRLDGDGNPVGSYAQASFQGSTTAFITAQIPTRFPKQIEFDFFDPGSVSPPVVGLSLDNVASNSDGGSLPGGFTAEPTWAADTTPNAITVVTHFNLKSTTGRQHIWNWGTRNSGGTAPKGFILECDQHPVTGVYTLKLDGGTGSLLSNGGPWYGYGEILANTWYRVTVTYEQLNSVARRLRVYLGAELVIDETQSVDFVLPSRGFQLGIDVEGSGFADAFFDETFVLRRALTPSEVLSQHNNGFWLEVAPNAVDLVAGWRMNAIIGSSPEVLPDFSGNGDSLELENTGMVLGAGAVFRPATGTVLRDRYRIEVQRIDVVEDAFDRRDAVELDSVVLFKDEEVAFAGLALAGVRIRANDQLAGSQPSFQFLGKWKNDIPIWDGLDPVAPTFTPGFSRNPAWIAASLATDAEFGMGSIFGTHSIDWESWLEWADYCDEEIPDQRGVFQPHTLIYAATHVVHGESWTLTVTGAIPPHFVAGYRVRVSDLTPAAVADYPVGDFTILEVVGTSPSSYLIRLGWPSGQSAPSLTSVIDNAGAAKVQGIEPRLLCDLPLVDRGVGGWDLLQQIAGIGRAAIVPLGDQLVAKVEKPRTATQLFTEANIALDSFRISGVRAQGRFNVATGEIQDLDRGWERSPVERRDPSVRDATSTTVIKRQTVDLRGITRRSQATRELDFRLAVNRLWNLFVEFETGANGAFVAPGDVFALSHPMPDWSFGGVCREDAATGGQLIISSAVDLDPALTYYAAVQDADSDAVGFAQLAGGQTGAIAAGTGINLASGLGFTPSIDDIWAIGPVTTTGSQLFQALSVALGQNVRVQIQAVNYDDSVYPDETVLEPVAKALTGPSAGRELSGESQRRTLLPEPMALTLRWEAARDPDTGKLKKALWASWAASGSDGARTSKIRLWLEDSDGERRMVAEAPASRRQERIPTDLIPRESVVRVIAQAVTDSGVAASLDRSAVASIAVRALFPVPSAPASSAATATGLQVVYRVEPASDAQGAALELWRGDAFLGDEIARLPIGARTHGPTDDWVRLPAGPDGRTDPPLLTRHILDTGGRGDWIEGTHPEVPDALGSPLSEESAEADWLSPWSGSTYSLSMPEMEDTVNIAGQDIIHWDPASSSLTASYEPPEIDLGSAQRVHVSAAFQGLQVHPTLFVDMPNPVSPEGKSWTYQGPLDPGDPDFGEVTVRIEWCRSDTADPGTNWLPFTPGLASFRSCRFRLALTRPSTGWDARIDRLAYSIRAVTGLGGGGGGAVSSVFGRTGAVVAASSDYDASQVDNDSGVSGAQVSDALDALDTDIASLDSAKADVSHASDHVQGGGDEIDGDTLDIDFSPAGSYIPNTSPPEVSDSAHLSAHLKGIANALDGKPDAVHTHTVSDVTDAGALASLDTVGATEIDDEAVTDAKLAHMAQDRLKGRVSSGTGDPEDLTAAQARTLLNVADGANAYTHPDHTGDVTSSADGATTIANDAVTNAKLANVATETIKGRVTAATGDPEDLTVAQVHTLLEVSPRHYLHLQATGGTNINASATNNAIDWTTQVDARPAIGSSDLTHDTGTNPSRIEVDVDCLVEAKLSMGLNGAGSARQAPILKFGVNGSSVLPWRGRVTYIRNTGSYTYGGVELVAEFPLDAGDYFEVFADRGASGTSAVTIAGTEGNLTVSITQRL